MLVVILIVSATRALVRTSVKHRYKNNIILSFDFRRVQEFLNKIGEIGLPGYERPRLLDANGIVRDLSDHVEDIDGRM